MGFNSGFKGLKLHKFWWNSALEFAALYKHRAVRICVRLVRPLRVGKCPMKKRMRRSDFYWWTGLQ